MSENNNKLTRENSRDLSVRLAWNGRENVDCQRPQVGPEQDVRLIQRRDASHHRASGNAKRHAKGVPKENRKPVPRCKWLHCEWLDLAGWAWHVGPLAGRDGSALPGCHCQGPPPPAPTQSLGHLSRIRAYPSFFTIQNIIMCTTRTVGLQYTLSMHTAQSINTYSNSMQKFALIFSVYNNTLKALFHQWNVR